MSGWAGTAHTDPERPCPYPARAVFRPPDRLRPAADGSPDPTGSCHGEDWVEAGMTMPDSPIRCLARGDRPGLDGRYCPCGSEVWIG